MWRYYYHRVNIKLYESILILFFAYLLGILFVFTTTFSYTLHSNTLQQIIFISILGITAVSTLYFVKKEAIFNILAIEKIKLSRLILFTLPVFIYLPIDYFLTTKVGYSPRLENINILGICIIYLLLTPVIEELCFRGILQSGFMNTKLWPILSFLTISIIWSLDHVTGSNYESVSIILFGVILSFIRYYSKSIYPCITSHFIVNLFWVIRYVS